MKRLIILFCMASFWLAMQAANTITVTSGAGHPGDEVTVSVAMTGTDAVTALELQLPLGEWLTYVDGSCLLNGDRNDGHSVTAATVASVSTAGNGTLRIYAYSLGLRPFRGTNGEVLSFRLRLGNAPGDLALSPSVMMSDATGAAVAATVRGGTATILCPALRVVTEQIDYGHVPIRSSYTRQLTLQNYGNEPLTITNIIPNNSELSASPTTLTIPACSSASTTITYSPLNRVPFEATLNIESDAVNAKIYNRWQTAQVIADPFSVNELHVQDASGTSDTEVEIALRMNNMEPIVGAQVSLHMPDALRYVDGSAALTERSDGHSITATVSNNTLTLFVYSSSNKPLKSDDGNFCTFRVLLNGQSGWYWLSPQNVVLGNAALENMTSATSGAYVQIQSPTISGSTSLGFGQQDATKPLTATYNIRNSGQVPLTIERATFLADGYRVVTPLPLTINNGSSRDIEIEYIAAQAGEFATTMNIYSNDPATRVKAVDVSGYAFSPNELGINGEYEDGDYCVHVNLSNDAEVAAVQFNITADPAMEMNGMVRKTARLENHTANIYPMGNGVCKVLVYSMTNEVITGNEGEIMSILFPSVDTSQDVTFSLSDVVLSSIDGRNLLSPTLTQPQEYTFDALPQGDVNEDGEIDVADLVAIVDCIARHIYDSMADLNGDDAVDVADIVTLVEKIVSNKQ